MAGFTLQQVRARPDPLLSFQWLCLDGSLPFDHPNEYLESIDLPFNNIKSDGVYVGSGYTCYPLAHEVEAFTATFYEDYYAASTTWLQDWKSRIKNFSTGVYGLPKDYKKTMTVGLLTTKGDIALQYKLIGIWPTSTASLSLNYNESGRITVSQTFSIDDVEIVTSMEKTRHRAYDTH